MLGVGTQFGDYRIEAVVGRGGMGIVFKAMHVIIGRTVALKLMLDEPLVDPTFRARFIRELRIAASVEHANVIPVYDGGERDGRLFIAMRYVEGPDLAQVLDANPGGLLLERAIEIITQVAGALDAAHLRGLVHRDVKPANILLSEQDRERIYLSDFGLTRLAEGGTALTSPGGFVGTLAYCAPEQIKGERIGPAADVYALGCVLFHMLTGRRPFERDSQMALLFAQVNAPVPDLRAIAPAVPAQLASVVARALAKSPNERFASAGELARAAGDAVALSPLAVTLPVPSLRAGWLPGAPSGSAAEAAQSRPTASTLTARGTWRARFRLPLQAANFTGRGAELDAIDQALGVADRAVVTQAITGLGGVGKSQLAARYVHQHADEYDIVAWIHAEDGGIADLSEFAVELGVVAAQLSPAQRAAGALRWLSGCHERWLLVLDNVATAEQLGECCPSTGNGRVIVTTRDRGIAQFGPALSLDVFDERVAVEYLLAQAARGEDRDGATRLVRALGYLPLALTHAGAYCAAGTTFDDYRELLGTLPVAELFDTHPEASYAQTVASTWQVSIEIAERQSPLARLALTMAAHLAPDAIPRRLFEVLLEDAADPSGRKRLLDAFNALHRLSLAEVDDEAISVHRLLQKTIRDDALAHRDTTATVRALAAVGAAFPSEHDQPHTWPQCERLLPHALAIAAALTSPGEAGEKLVELLNSATDYLLRAEARAVDTATRASAYAQRVLGAEHPSTLTANINLAFAYWAVGRTREAIELGERVLADRERILGHTHPETLGARNNLAVSYRAAGRSENLIELGTRVLADNERILGHTHPDTLRAGGNLAVSLRAAERTGEAIALGTRVLADCKQILGPEHAETLRARAHLAACYWSAGRIGEAIEFSERVLTDRERILGPEHAETLRARVNLAASYRTAARTAEAIELEEQVLADRQRLLGPKHPETLRVRRHLAASYGAAGRTNDAIATLERALVDGEGILGAEHPHTLSVRAHLAASYRAAGRTADAQAIEQHGQPDASPLHRE